MKRRDSFEIFFNELNSKKIKIEEMEMPGMKYAMFPFDPIAAKIAGGLAQSPMHTPSSTGSIIYLNANPDLQNALDKIEKAKQEGLPITAETCPHYIYFNAENIPDAQSIYKCAPPIREKANNDLLKQAFQNDILDFIATDHSPASPSIKEIETGDLKKAWGGIAGLQFLLPASWTALKENISLEEFIPLVTSEPAKFINEKNRGEIKVGNYADFVVWNPEEKKVITKEDILFRHKISPYIGEDLFGTIQQTIVNGETVFQEGNIINEKKGKWLLRK